MCLRQVLVLGLAVAGLSVAGPRRGRACSPPPSPPSYVTFGASAPGASAEQVPTDSAIAIDLQTQGDPGSSRLTVVVSEVGGRQVSGSTQIHAWDRLFASWRPSSPLRANTRYQVEAAVESQLPRPSTARGPERLSFSFSTGAAASPALVIGGKMQVTLEREDRPDYSTCEPGLCFCSPTAKVRGTRARVLLPGVSGGQQPGGYQTLVMVTADRPHDFSREPPPSDQRVFGNGAAATRLGDPAGTTVFQIDARDQAYRPCFAFRVIDVAGKVAVGEPVCLDQLVPATETLPATDPPDPPDPRDPGAAGGCAVAAGGGGPACWAAALFALAVLRRRRRG